MIRCAKIEASGRRNSGRRGGGGEEGVAREKKERKIYVMTTAYENRIFKKLR